MNIRLPAVALSAVLVAGLGLAPAFGQTGVLTVTTDSDSYGSGDTVTVSGNVGNILAGHPVALQLLAPNGNLIQIAQLDVGSDGSFGTTISAGGPLWQAQGEYIVKVQYSANRAETTFGFGGAGSSAIPPPPPTGPRAAIEGTDFTVGYTITGGSITSITPDVDASSLVIAIDSTDDGVLTITLPREVIDARLNGGDGNFVVLVDLEEAEFEETATDTFRTLTIPFSNGASQIDIIGTFVVPEFGAIALLVLAAAVVSIVVVSARSRLSITQGF